MHNATPADYVALVERESDLSDGVPIIPVTGLRLAAAVQASGRNAQDVLGTFPNGRTVTVEALAEVALLAGCRPDYMPIVVTAFEIMLEPQFPIGLFTGSHVSHFPYLVVNGPIRERIALNCRYNLYGPGSRANSTIGRALRLGLIGFAGAPTAADDRTPIASAYKFACVIGEDEENSPWAPLHTTLGFDASDSTVMLFAAEQPGNINHQMSADPECLLESMAEELRTVARFRRLDAQLPEGGFAPKSVIVLGEDHRGYFRDAGWTRERMQDYLAAITHRNAGKIRQAGYSQDPRMKGVADADPVRPYNGPQDFIILAGGSGGGRTMSGAAVYGEIRKIPETAAGASLPAGSMPPVTIDDYSLLVDRYIDQGMTDGWPVLPPDSESVDRMIAASGRDAEQEVGRAHWRPDPITIRDVAINAHMAGCLPEYMPLLVPMFELLFSPETATMGISGSAASTGGHACFFLIRGPIVQQLGINSGAGLFGPGTRVNVTIGRAIRMAMMNLAGLKPALGDRSTLGQPYKYGAVLAESEDAPWGHLDVGLELGPKESGIALIWTHHTRLTIQEETDDPERLLRAIVDECSTVQQFDSPSGRSPGETEPTPVNRSWKQRMDNSPFAMMLSRGHRQVFAQAGWSREKLQSRFSESIGRTVADIRKGGLETSIRLDYGLEDDVFVRMFKRPDLIKIISAGGEGGATLAAQIISMFTKKFGG